LEHFDIICNSPSHIYHSALPFCPSSSWLHKFYSAELLQGVQVVKGLPAEWGTCLRTVSLDSSPWDLSYYNNTIAVGSWGGDIIILNAITGSQTAVLSGHPKLVFSVAYSPDGVSLVSGSLDKTIKHWDVQTGGVVRTFYGHTEYVLSVSVSADCTRIASGSGDHTTRLWDIQTGECYCVITQGHSVDHVNFFPTDPQHFLSVCGGKVRQWDIDKHQVGHAYDGSHVTFSSDGTQSISCYMGAVKVQNSSSGVTVTEFQTANNVSKCCCFSPDSRLVAVASHNTAYVWDITSSTPNLIETFTGHTTEITSLVFSSPTSLISASEDQSIKFWQIVCSLKDSLEAPEPTSLTLANIRSITLQTRDGIIITSDSDGVVRTWDILTGLCKASFQTPAKGIFYKGDAQLINGKLIFGWCEDGKISIWDSEKGELLTIDKPGDSGDLKMSEDGSRVFCLADWYIQGWSIQTGKSVGRVWVGFESYGPLAVDNSKVWFWDGSYSREEGWDFAGSSPVRLPYAPPYRLHPNGIMLWDSGLQGVKDTRTGKVVFQLSKRYGRPHDVQWNAQYLVACFSVMEVLVLDFSYILK